MPTELRSTLRMFWRHPVWAGAVCLILTLALGTVVAMFILVNALLFRALPYPDAESLFAVHDRYKRMENRPLGVCLERPRPNTSFTPADSVAVLDLGRVPAALPLVGFQDGFSDDHYAYFVPNTNGTGPDGRVVRVDLQDFTAGGVKVLDLAVTNNDLKGFQGGFVGDTDSTRHYGYFVPYSNKIGIVNGVSHYGKMAQVDLEKFEAPPPAEVVKVLDLTKHDELRRVTYSGGFIAAGYGYLVPYRLEERSGSGIVVQVDLRNPQNFPNSPVVPLDLTKATEHPDPSLVEFVGGFTDGRGHGYLVPGSASGKFVKVGLGSNFRPESVTVLDLAKIDARLGCFEGGFADNAGKFGYLVPFGCGEPAGSSGKVVRVKLSDDFRHPSTNTVQVLDLAETNPALTGFDGGFTDGRYGYFVPAYNPDPSGSVARVDLDHFTTSGVTALDLTRVDSTLKGFDGGFTDKQLRYGYLVPFRNGKSDDPHGGHDGKVVRILLEPKHGNH
jgi:hypothetical protein